MAARDAKARADRFAWLAPAGAAGCVLALAATALLPHADWRAWLGAAFLWASTSIGALALLMIMRLAPGDWSEELGPFMEALTLLLPLGAILLLPVLAETGRLYPWTQQHLSTAFRAAYLSPPFFVVRTLAWYAMLFALAHRLVLRPGRSVALACVGLALLVVLDLPIATDWLLSLDPDFASSGFGLYVLDIQMLTAFALMTGALVVSGRPIRRPGILAALLICLLLFWAYLAFTHYVITWSDNLPPGVSWYQRRGGPWRAVIWIAAACRLAPLFLLLFSAVRTSPRMLLALSAAILFGSVLEAAWLTLPATDFPHPSTATDIALFAFANLAMAALTAGGFLRAFAWRAARKPAPAIARRAAA
ncbi:hypothetical protein [Phenylobacterium sp.]|jgi:hypothetical protein|uniref:hypothetical protein n=1 Tax=Phenylobacterium sp. TaxID=1871053 RepID=UPI002F3E88FB